MPLRTVCAEQEMPRPEHSLRQRIHPGGQVQSAEDQLKAGPEGGAPNGPKSGQPDLPELKVGDMVLPRPKEAR